jgi:recombination protein RecR
MDKIEELARLFERFPGIGPRQAKRFVYHLLSTASSDRTKMSELISAIGDEVSQCPECMRFSNGTGKVCAYCADLSRDNGMLLVVEKDQDLAAVERSGSYKGKYFVLGGILTLSGKGAIREKELLKRIERGIQNGLKEVVLALSATSEGENTTDHLGNVLSPYRTSLTLTLLGRGLATGTELEYSDKETLAGALQNRKET